VVTESSVLEGPLGDALGARPLLRREAQTPWRVIAWCAVALIHLLLIGVLLISEKPPRMHRALTPMETELLLTLQKQGRAPKVQLVRPLAPDEIAPEIITAPITLPPPAPPTAREVMQSIGESMACGAGTYETLTAADRAHCRHTPWRGKKLANGTMVLDVTKPPPPTDFHISGGDFQRRQTETVNPCPVLAVTPCIHREIYGDGPGKGIPAPF